MPWWHYHHQSSHPLLNVLQHSGERGRGGWERGRWEGERERGRGRERERGGRERERERERGGGGEIIFWAERWTNNTHPYLAKYVSVSSIQRDVNTVRVDRVNMSTRNQLKTIAFMYTQPETMVINIIS